MYPGTGLGSCIQSSFLCSQLAIPTLLSSPDLVVYPRRLSWELHPKLVGNPVLQAKAKPKFGTSSHSWSYKPSSSLHLCGRGWGKEGKGKGYPASYDLEVGTFPTHPVPIFPPPIKVSKNLGGFYLTLGGGGRRGRGR